MSAPTGFTSWFSPQAEQKRREFCSVAYARFTTARDVERAAERDAFMAVFDFVIQLTEEKWMEYYRKGGRA